MSLIDEFRFYCEDPSPVGALLLTGAWGSGKTYFIDNVLTRELKENYIFIRISLFGLDSLVELKKIVSLKYIECLSGFAISDKSLKALQGTKIILSKLPLPFIVKNIFSVDFLDLVTINNTIGGRRLVLVFDDLERTLIPYVDVLGCINDYCENNKIHTVIVANENKLYDSNSQKDNLKYIELKEKIVQRTLKYTPDYKMIISEIISGYKTENFIYKTFLCETISLLMDFFYHEYIDPKNHNAKQDDTSINFRILKSTLYDFERIFPFLKFESSNQELFKWFISFLCFSMTWKTGRLSGQSNSIGTEHWEKIIKKDFGIWYEKRYSLYTIQHWLVTGEWDEKAITEELSLLRERNVNQLPDVIVRIDDLRSIDDVVMEKGFPIVLRKAYAGDLSLNDYVSLFEKSIDAREISYTFPIPINWNRISIGIRKCIKRMISKNEPDSQNKRLLSSERISLLSEEERNVYVLIERCRVGGQLDYETAKYNIIKKIADEPIATLRSSNSIKLYAFHEDLMNVILTTYLNLNNNDKYSFELEFKNWWGGCCTWESFDKEESKNTFRRMSIALKEKANECLQNGRKLECINLTQFAGDIDEIIQLLSNPMVSN